MKIRFNKGSIIELALILLICFFLLWLNFSEVISRLKVDMREQLTEFERNTDEVSEQAEKAYRNYQLVQKHIARLGVYYLNNSADPFSKETLDRLSNTLEAEGVYIINKKGDVLVSSGQEEKSTVAALLPEELRSVTEKHPVSEAVSSLKDERTGQGEDQSGKEDQDQVQEGEGFLPDEVGEEKEEKEEDADLPQAIESAVTGAVTYCSCYMDPGHIFVVSDYYEDFITSVNATEDIFDVLNRSRYGDNGFFFFLTKSGKGLLPMLNPDNNQTMEPIDLPEKNIVDGFGGFLSIRGKMYYCSIKSLKAEDSYVACVLPIKELLFTLCFVSLPSVAGVLLSILLIHFYAQVLTLESSKKEDGTDASVSFRNRLFILTILCVCATAVFSIYIRTIFIYSFTLAQNVKNADEMQYSIGSLNEIQEDGSIQYRKTVTIFTKAAELLISENPKYQDRENLNELADILGAEHILVYDKTGRVTLSDENYTGLTLSDDPKKLSNEFWWVLRREMILIQEKADEHYLDQPYLFSGITLRDEKGDFLGMVQLAIEPSFHDNMVAATSIQSVLASYGNTGNAVPLAVHKDTKMVYSSFKPFDNLSADELGITPNQLKDEYKGLFYIQHEDLTGCTQASGDYWAIYSSFSGSFFLQGVRSGLLSALPGILTEILFFLYIFSQVRRKKVRIPEQVREFAVNRELKETKAESHILALTGGLAIVCAGLISLIVLTGNLLFEKDSVGYYIFVYPWSKSFNIFTINRCLIILCVTAFVMFLVMKLLGLLASLLSFRQETVIRLLLSFTRYFGWVGAIYYCMTLLGVPTISLLASAGALTAVFSIGAQNIVADILAGLFIIFEGSFKVGDMITVDDWHGRVVEIGIRNTTIHDLITNDVKILNNSTIKKVINFSTYPSNCSVMIGIEYGMNLKELEAIIEKEKPVVEKNMGDMITRFRYLGVEQFEDSSILLKFDAACNNMVYPQVKRALSREIKMMFDRNDIHVPFPQIVLHDGDENE